MSRLMVTTVVLGIFSIALGVALIIVVATDDGDGGAVDEDDGGYAGMMSAMADMDSDQMLQQMQEVLGNEGYAKMLAHMQEHRAGNGDAHGDDIDGMMHEMMDGMMGIMPADSGGHMFPNREMPMDDHEE